MIQTNAAEIARKLKESAKRFPRETFRQTEAAMALIVNEFQNEVIMGTPAGVGGAAGLRGSIFGETVKNKNGITGIVGSPLEYADVIEYGRKPGSRIPPIQPIALWAEKKLGLSRQQAIQAAFPIARKIAIFGFKTWPNGARMFEKGWEKVEDFAISELGKVPEKVAEQVL